MNETEQKAKAIEAINKEVEEIGGVSGDAQNLMDLLSAIAGRGVADRFREAMKLAYVAGFRAGEQKGKEEEKQVNLTDPSDL